MTKTNNDGYEDMEIEGENDYLRLVSGSVANVNILSQSPTKDKVHWENKQKTICTGSDCSLCASGHLPKSRWTITVYDRKDEKAKKFEFGPMIASQIKGIAEMLKESNKTIHEVDIRIKTTGAGLETEYQVLNVPLTGPIPQEIIDQYRLPF